MLSISRLKSESAKAWAIAQKDIRIYYAKPPVIMFGLLFPVFMFASYSLKRNVSTASLIPGLLSITIFFMATSTGPVVLPFEKRTKTFDRLVSAPISLKTIIFAKAIPGLVFSSFVGSIPLIIGVVFFDLRITNPFLLLVGFIIGGLMFSSLGISITSPTSFQTGQQLLSLNMIRLPLLFISGVFVRFDEMHPTALYLARLSPLSYMTDLIRGSLGEGYYFDPLLSVGVLTSFLICFISITVFRHEKVKKTE